MIHCIISGRNVSFLCYHVSQCITNCWHDSNLGHFWFSTWCFGLWWMCLDRNQIQASPWGEKIHGCHYSSVVLAATHTVSVSRERYVQYLLLHPSNTSSIKCLWGGRGSGIKCVLAGQKASGSTSYLSCYQQEVPQCNFAICPFGLPRVMSCFESQTFIRRSLSGADSRLSRCQKTK